MFKKFLTDSGACSGYISSSVNPASVSSVTHFEAIVFTSAESNGSAFAAGVGDGRALAFPASFAGADGEGEGVVCCAKTAPAKTTEKTKVRRTVLLISTQFSVKEKHV
jgi:hypothetical protein